MITREWGWRGADVRTVVREKYIVNVTRGILLVCCCFFFVEYPVIFHVTISLTGLTQKFGKIYK